MDDLQGPEVEAILLHFACHHHTLCECAVEESLVECPKCRQVLSVSVFLNNEIIFLENRENI